MIARSWYGSAIFMTRSGCTLLMSAMTSSVLSASTCAVVIFVFVLSSSFALSASHLESVRLAMHSSVNTSSRMQHLRIATDATPPQPMTNTFAMIFLPMMILVYTRTRRETAFPSSVRRVGNSAFSCGAGLYPFSASSISRTILQATAVDAPL